MIKLKLMSNCSIQDLTGTHAFYLLNQLFFSDIQVVKDDSATDVLSFVGMKSDQVDEEMGAEIAVFFAILDNKYGRWICDANVIDPKTFMEWIRSCYVEPAGLGAALYCIFNSELGFSMLWNENRGFTFPGGKVEEGESFEEACIREVAEETGMIAKVNPVHKIRMMCGSCLCELFYVFEENTEALPKQFGPMPEFAHEGVGLWNPMTWPSKYLSFNMVMQETLFSIYNCRAEFNHEVVYG